MPWRQSSTTLQSCLLPPVTLPTTGFWMPSKLKTHVSVIGSVITTFTPDYLWGFVSLIVCFLFFFFSRVCHLKLSLGTSWLRISNFWLSSDKERCWHKRWRQGESTKNGLCIFLLCLASMLTLALKWPSPMILTGHSHLTSPAPYKIPPDTHLLSVHNSTDSPFITFFPDECFWMSSMIPAPSIIYQDHIPMIDPAV